MKAAAAAANGKTRNETNNSETESELKSMDAENSNSNSCSSAVDKPEPMASFSKAFNANSSDSSSKMEYVPEIQTEEERIEFQRKMQEKLQAHLAAEGKLYPKPKPSPAINTATGFANDGSFLEMFKRMQQQIAPAVEESGAAQTQFYPGTSAAPVPPTAAVAIAAKVVNPIQVKAVQQPQPQPVPVPIVGRRRGGKILKTGIVKKPKPIEESYVDTPNDAWNLYLQEVKKYKNASCDADSKTRPLVK